MWMRRVVNTEPELTHVSQDGMPRMVDVGAKAVTARAATARTLVRLPPELMDYTILHELVHTRVKNHSPRFWAMLARHVPDAKAIDQQLNRYSSLLAG